MLHLCRYDFSFVYKCGYYWTSLIAYDMLYIKAIELGLSYDRLLIYKNHYDHHNLKDRLSCSLGYLVSMGILRLILHGNCLMDTSNNNKLHMPQKHYTLNFYNNKLHGPLRRGGGRAQECCVRRVPRCSSFLSPEGACGTLRSRRGRDSCGHRRPSTCLRAAFRLG